MIAHNDQLFFDWPMTESMSRGQANTLVCGSTANSVFGSDGVFQPRQQHLARRPKAIVPPVVFAGPDNGVLTNYAFDLGQMGITARLVHSGLDCIQLVRHVAPCVLVLDMDPGLLWGSADDVLAMLCDASDVPPIPVILLTSTILMQSKYRWPAKLRAIMPKPVDIEVLVHVVETWWKPPWCDQEWRQTHNDSLLRPIRQEARDDSELPASGSQ